MAVMARKAPERVFTLASQCQKIARLAGCRFLEPALFLLLIGFPCSENWVLHAQILKYPALSEALGSVTVAPAPTLLLASVRNMTSPRMLPFAPNMKTWVRLEIPIPLAPPKLRCFLQALFSSFKYCCISNKAGLVPAFLFANRAARMQI